MSNSFFHRCFVLMLSALIALSSTAAGAVSEFSRAWQSPNTSIVLDAYEYTVIDWSKIKNNDRLAGFINKATEGLRPRSNCRRNSLCRLRWRRYAAAKELYHTRKTLAKTLGLKWGAYHLGRPGNPIKQAKHFLEFARPGPDDLIAIDIEENDPKRWMSLKEAEVFSQYIYERLGRYPVLYTNHSTARYIAANRAELPLLSRLNLWYARYRASMRGAFPMGYWDSYTIWQFSAHTNCSPQACLWRINGTDHWIDVNVVNMPVAELRQKWPFNELTARRPGPTRDRLPPQIMVDAGQARSVDGLTGYAEQPKVLSAARMFEALLSKPRMALRGKPPLPTWRPGAVFVAKQTAPKNVEVAAVEQSKPTIVEVPKPAPAEVVDPEPKRKVVADKQEQVPAKLAEAVEPRLEVDPKVTAKQLVAQISPRNTQKVNALLLETAKWYLNASRNGRTSWETPVQAPAMPSPVMAVKGAPVVPTWRPGTLIESELAEVEPERLEPVLQGPKPVMALKGRVGLPIWRPGTQLADAVPETIEPTVEAEPKPAPVMLVKGDPALPKWRPGTKFANLEAGTPVLNVAPKTAPKMAIAGPVTLPSWRPGTDVRQIIQDSESDIIEIASSASFVPLIADIQLLAQRTAVPTWRPDPS
ncbi:MAG: hypothetical protein HRU27_01015 [Rhizobiaceae bacterium]|nr:hypothetical protein [Hyphomicrobiales bacterium]NRB29155.1 hypothetical protein [Rhizobiaceae bacterium]